MGGTQSPGTRMPCRHTMCLAIQRRPSWVPSLCPHQRQLHLHQPHQLRPLCLCRCQCQYPFLCLRQHQVSAMQSLQLSQMTGALQIVLVGSVHQIYVNVTPPSWSKLLMNPNSSEGDPARSGQQVSFCVFVSRWEMF